MSNLFDSLGFSSASASRVIKSEEKSPVVERSSYDALFRFLRKPLLKASHVVLPNANRLVNPEEDGLSEKAFSRSDRETKDGPCEITIGASESRNKNLRSGLMQARVPDDELAGRNGDDSPVIVNVIVNENGDPCGTSSPEAASSDKNWMPDVPVPVAAANIVQPERVQLEFSHAEDANDSTSGCGLELFSGALGADDGSIENSQPEKYPDSVVQGPSRASPDGGVVSPDLQEAMNNAIFSGTLDDMLEAAQRRIGRLGEIENRTSSPPCAEIPGTSKGTETVFENTLFDHCYCISPDIGVRLDSCRLQVPRAKRRRIEYPQELSFMPKVLSTSEVYHALRPLATRASELNRIAHHAGISFEEVARMSRFHIHIESCERFEELLEEIGWEISSGVRSTPLSPGGFVPAKRKKSGPRKTKVKKIKPSRKGKGIIAARIKPPPVPAHIRFPFLAGKSKFPFRTGKPILVNRVAIVKPQQRTRTLTTVPANDKRPPPKVTLVRCTSTVPTAQNRPAFCSANKWTWKGYQGLVPARLGFSSNDALSQSVLPVPDEHEHARRLREARDILGSIVYNGKSTAFSSQTLEELVRQATLCIQGELQFRTSLQRRFEALCCREALLKSKLTE